jgi:hypothetical protein
VANTKENITVINNDTLPSAQSAINTGTVSAGANTGGNNTNNTNTESDEDAGTANENTTQTNPIKLATTPRPNPLGNFASYTYQLTLYMVTPDAYDAYVNTGRKNINALQNGAAEPVDGGAFIIAQSGGINTKYRFQPYFSTDYYIENLTFKSSVSGVSEVAETELAFDIIEPYGFSFLSNLRRAGDAIQAYDPNLNSKIPDFRQFFIIGIRYYGYDAEGNLVLGKDSPLSTATADSFYETFYDIKMTAIKFKLDGKATVYHCTATSLPISVALGTQRGTLKQGAQFEAATLEEALDNLVNQLNAIERENNKTSSLNTYSIAYIGDEGDVARIKNSSMVIPSDILKASWGGSGAKNTSESNDSLSVTTIPNSTKKTLSFRNETSVAQAISDLFKQSTYMTDAMTLLNTTSSGKTSQPVTNNPNPVEMKWFRLSTEISGAKWNSDLNDWVYNITYVIQPYSAPSMYSPFISKTAQYYGPFKRYEYFFTGKNTEVLSFEVAYDNTYIQVVIDDSGLDRYRDSSKGNGPSNAPIAPGKRTDKPRMGLTNLGLEAQNQALTSLYDSAAYAKCKLVIMGDPDFLVSENPSSLNQVYNQFYGSNSRRVNPNGGQVFVEIDFKEAVDYDTASSGLLNINDSIVFWRPPKIVADSSKGIILIVKYLTSKFENGKFTQILELAPAVLDDSVSSEYETPRADSVKETAQVAKDKENVRTLTEQPNYIYPVTAGGLPGQNNSSKPNNQLLPDFLTPVTASQNTGTNIVTTKDTQTGQTLTYDQTVVDELSQGDD